MPNRAAHPLRIPATLLASLAFVFAGLPVPAPAQAPPPVSAAQFDPSDVYFQAYLAARSAEQLEKDGKFIDAAEKLEQADKLLATVTRYYPDWKPGMVSGRAAKTRESLDQVRPKADAQRRKERGVIAELEGDQQEPVQIPEAPDPLQADPIAQRQLDANEAEVERLRQLIQDSMTSPAKVRDMERERSQLKDQLRAAEATARTYRARLAKAPVESELKALNDRIEGLEQERQAMAMALTQSREQHTKSLAKIAILETDLKLMSQTAADLQRDLKLQRKTSNDTVAGMRKQLKALQDTLTHKDQDLTAANNQIALLKRELQQSSDAFAQLRGERDALAAERDQLKEFLNLSEPGRIQEVIKQNLGLVNDLREAEKKIKILHDDNNSTKDDFTDALRDLAVAKAQINNLTRERRAQDKRLAELSQRLRREQGALDNGEAAADFAEIETLRNVIKRQLLTQERRRQASKILIDAAKQLGSADEKTKEAIDLLESPEIVLTPDEQRLIADRADVELISPYARSPESVGRRNQQLNKNIQGYDRAAIKAFAAQRFLPARELFELILEDHPGHVATLCKLGVVNLRLDDPIAAADTFRKAVELDENNPFAHRMLGFSLMTMGDIDGAEQNVRRSVTLAPEDAKSLNLLGTITYRQGDPKESESLYHAAIASDPVPSEPYFNLALLFARNNRIEDARTYYQQALQHGALPDPKLEQTITTQ